MPSKAILQSKSDTLKMYALTGVVAAVKPEAAKITVHHAHIRGLKEPMERDYALKDAAIFPRVKEGDFVRATLLTDHADVWLLDEATFVHKRVRRIA
jgi:Cu/Ag efflux protein CusF